MTDAQLVPIDLTDEERELMVLALNEYGGPAKHAYQLLCSVVGQSTKSEWTHLRHQLMEAIENKEPLSDLDWARALFLTEVSFASDLAGAGLDLERGVLLLLLILWLNKRTQMTASLVIRRPGIAVGVSASRVVALPLHSLSRCDPLHLLDLLCHVTRAKKELVLALQIFIRLDRPEFRGELFQLGSALRHDHADRLVDLESHRHQFAGDFPTHAETRACPVGFDYAF